MLKNIQLTVVEDYAALSSAGAKLFAAAVAKNPTSNYGFATGGTPEGMYEELCKMSVRGEVDLSKITAFNLDEYVNLKQSDPQSYFYYMAHKLFDATGVPHANRHIPKGDAPCPHAESARYEKQIVDSGGIH